MGAISIPMAAMGEPSSRSGARVAQFRVLAICVSLALFLGVPEVLLRAFDVPAGRFTAIHFGNDPHSPDLFRRDPDLHWRLSSSAKVEFLGRTVWTDGRGLQGRADSPRRILVLGDSTPFGWRVREREAFPAVLESVLSTTTGSDWGVANAGVPGYSSFQTRLQAERLVPAIHPEVVVVCVGNNDGWRGLRSDADVHRDRWLVRPVERLVARSRVLLWLSDRFLGKRDETFDPTRAHGDRPRVDPAEYAENLSVIIRIAHAHGARVVLVAPPVNLLRPPWNLGSARGFGEWGEWFSEVGRRIDEGEAAAVLPEIERRRERSPESFHALWLHGYALTALGERAEGHALLERALDRYESPVRARREYRRAVASVAVREGLPFIDPEVMFRQHTDVPERLFLDHCHPTPEGHGLIAEALASVVRSWFP